MHGADLSLMDDTRGLGPGAGEGSAADSMAGDFGLSRGDQLMPRDTADTITQPGMEPPIEPVKPVLEPARKTRRTGRTRIFYKEK